MVVRINRAGLFTHQFTEAIPPFVGSYYLGGVPEKKMPAKSVAHKHINTMAAPVFHC